MNSSSIPTLVTIISFQFWVLPKYSASLLFYAVCCHPFNTWHYYLGFLATSWLCSAQFVQILLKQPETCPQLVKSSSTAYFLAFKFLKLQNYHCFFLRIELHYFSVEMEKKYVKYHLSPITFIFFCLVLYFVFLLVSLLLHAL